MPTVESTPEAAVARRRLTTNRADLRDRMSADHPGCGRDTFSVNPAVVSPSPIRTFALFLFLKQPLVAFGPYLS